jgi:cell division initiation protein
MNYTTKELENICFKREILYGYNRGQINNILSKVCEDYELLKKENDELQTEITIMKETVKHYKTIEESLQHTLIIAQRTSETITNNATEKANNTIKEAEINAQKLINIANQKIENIKLEYEEIKKSLNTYKIRSQALLSTTIEILKNSFDEKNE